MKLHVAIIFTALTLTMMVPPTAKAQVSFSAGVQLGSPAVQISSRADFYEPLSPYGTWVNFSTYGRCWRPTQIDAGWRPYSNGEWVWTDAGWYWQSDEPWAWACYHYGSWYYDTNYGWIWIPGNEWAPAWVTWRYSDDYVGWAPCGPGLTVLGPSFFMFADVHHFRDRHHGRDLIVNNTRIVNRTKIVNRFPRQTVNINGSRRTIVSNPGPGVQPIERATGTRFTPRPVDEIVRQSRTPDTLRREEPRRDQRQFDQGQPRRESVPPTGGDESRTYQQRQQRQPIYSPRQQPLQPYRQPEVVPQEPDRRSREQRPDLNPPPTGRDQPRTYREVPNPTPPARERTFPPRAAPPAAPPVERVLPPTGRQPERPVEAPRVERPPVREGPPATPPGQDGDRGRRRDGDQ
jgi:hypothetical protein